MTIESRTIEVFSFKCNACGKWAEELGMEPAKLQLGRSTLRFCEECRAKFAALINHGTHLDNEVAS